MSPIPIPNAETIQRASELPVFDASGNKVTFGTLFRDKETIVVFIRHFFCGICQAYVSQLASIRTEALARAGRNLVIIGCGGFQPIKSYCETTGYKGPIYADPSRELYRLFGLVENLDRTPTGQKKKTYLENESYISNIISSIWQGPLKNPRNIGKQGNISQNGGEFIFGPGEKCSFASRMEHTEDHIEVTELMREAGVEYP